MMKPRILLLCHEFPPIGGGAAAVCAALAKEYLQQGAFPTVVTMGFEHLPQRETIGGIPVVRVLCGRRRKEMASPWEALVWARRCRPVVQVLHELQPFDVTHAHFIMPAGIVAGRFKESFGVPFAITPHGSDVPGYNRERLKLAHHLARPWWLRICRHADRIVSPSASLLRLIESRTSHARAQVIPNGFEPGRFKPLEKQKRILLCSRLVERKGFHHFLAAIRDLEPDGWSVDVVGEGPMRTRLEAIASRCKIPVRLHGWIDNDDPKLAELYGKAMIFALPSECENFSIALLEAMSAGCAVITTNVSGNPEVIGEAGCLIEPNDMAQLRAATLDLIHAPGRCLELGRRASRRAAECFNWERIAEEYLDVLAGCCQVPGHPLEQSAA